MSKKAKKVPPACTPQSWGEADKLMAEFGELSGQSVRIQAGCDDAVAKVMATFQKQLAPLQTRMAVIVEALECYATANRKALTDDGKTKTVTMTAGSFGWRCCPPSIKWKSGYTGEKILTGIREIVGRLNRRKKGDAKMAAILDGFIRIKQEPDKEAMKGDPGIAVLIPGVTIVTDKEEFFVDPTIVALPEPK